MYRQRGVYPLYRSPHSVSSRHVAAVYNQAGNDYVTYADGDPERLFCFDGLHAYADRQLWSLLERKLGELKAAGANSVTILDAGCGPGTWLRRVVTHAHRLGFCELPHGVSMSPSRKLKLLGDWRAISPDFRA